MPTKPRSFEAGTWRRFCLYFTASVLLALSVVIVFDYLAYRNQQEQALLKQKSRLQAAKTTLARDLSQAVTDVQILLDVQAGEALSQIPGIDRKDLLIGRLEALVSYSGIYNQGRFFDSAGRELTRVTIKESKASTLSEAELEEAHRYCVDQALQSSEKRFYIASTQSPGNSTPGSAPPSICLSSPAHDADGTLIGAVVLHYPRVELFKGIGRALEKTEGSPILINSSGYLMFGSEYRWVPYHLIQDKVSSKVEHAQLWSAVQDRDTGTLEIEGELFLFLTLRPQQMVQEAFPRAVGKDKVVVKDRAWKLLSQLNSKYASYSIPDRLQERSYLILPLLAGLAGLSGLSAGARAQILAQRQAVRCSDSRLRTILDSTGTLAYFKDLNGRYLFANRGLEKALGRYEHEIIGKTDQEVGSRVGAALFDADCGTQALERPVARERVVNVDSEPRTYHSNMVPLRDGEGKIYGSCGIATDITSLRRAEARLLHLAHHDSLTGLPNRLLFREKLQQAVAEAKRDNHALAVLYLDLDRFKLINDTQGHHIGDLLLRKVGGRLRECVREEDTVARLGGDEFSVLLNHVEHPEGAINVAQKILHTVAEPMRLEGGVVSVGVSVGIALYPDDALTADELAMAADAAMYRAKERGRRTYAFYSRDLADLAHRHLRIERELRRALEQDELLLFYQPQICLETFKVVGAEALLRWQHPEHGLLSPGEVIDVAEHCGIIHELGEWVMREACRQVKQWQAEGLVILSVAVNVSGHQIASGNLKQMVEAAMVDAGLEEGAPGMEIEITESVLQQPEWAGRVLEELSRMGVKTAIDDFGTGYSSLHQLKLLPVDKLKVAGVFMEGTPDNPDDAAIAAAVVSLGHSLRLPVVAEGVENEAQVAFLKEIGCDIAQGYYFGRPMPASEFRRFCLTRAKGIEQV